MDNESKVIQDLIEKYGEWFEMAEDQTSALMIKILVKKLIHERAKSEHYERLLKAKSL